MDKHKPFQNSKHQRLMRNMKFAVILDLFVNLCSMLVVMGVGLSAPYASILVIVFYWKVLISGLSSFSGDV